MSCSWRYVLSICCLRYFIFSKKIRETLKARFTTGSRATHVNTFSSFVSFKFFMQKRLLKTQCHLSFHRDLTSILTAVLPTERLSQMFSTPFWEEGGVSWMSMFCTLCWFLVHAWTFIVMILCFTDAGANINSSHSSQRFLNT